MLSFHLIHQRRLLAVKATHSNHGLRCAATRARLILRQDLGVLNAAVSVSCDRLQGNHKDSNNYVTEFTKVNTKSTCLC